MFALLQQILQRLARLGRDAMTWLETPVEVPWPGAGRKPVKRRPRPPPSEKLESKLRGLKPPPAVSFRPFEAGDTARCLELYRLNEVGRFPKGIYEVYERTLAEEPEGYMVVEFEGRTLATCGVCRDEHNKDGILSYGLIEPASQRLGIGTAMLLVRLVLLGRFSPEIGMPVYLWAVTGSARFYQGLGFIHMGCLPRACDDDPDQFTMSLRLTPHLLKVCEDTLARWGIEVPSINIRQFRHAPAPGGDPQTAPAKAEAPP